MLEVRSPCNGHLARYTRLKDRVSSQIEFREQLRVNFVISSKLGHLIFIVDEVVNR